MTCSTLAALVCRQQSAHGRKASQVHLTRSHQLCEAAVCDSQNVMTVHGILMTRPGFDADACADSGERAENKE